MITRKKPVTFQFKQETLAVINFAMDFEQVEVSKQEFIEECVRTSLLNVGMFDGFKSLSPDEKNRFCKGLDLKY